MDVVFHVATAAPTASNAYNQDLMRTVNIDGTRNVVAACVAAGVTRLVFTSSSSVVFDGSDLNGVDESRPYAARPMDYYTHTKIEGGRGGMRVPRHN
jgi:sterol-4alpha-carboxylate 3-dehydrogenase (decarboxylating)